MAQYPASSWCLEKSPKITVFFNSLEFQAFLGLNRLAFWECFCGAQGHILPTCPDSRFFVWYFLFDCLFDSACVWTISRPSPQRQYRLLYSCLSLKCVPQPPSYFFALIKLLSKQTNVFTTREVCVTKCSNKNHWSQPDWETGAGRVKKWFLFSRLNLLLWCEQGQPQLTCYLLDTKNPGRTGQPGKFPTFVHDVCG